MSTLYAEHAPVGRNHPRTARDAAQAAFHRSGTDRVVIFDLLAEADGHTSDEIEVLLGWPHQTVSARLNGLERDEFIARSGRQRRTRHGRLANVYVVTRRGQQARRLV